MSKFDELVDYISKSYIMYLLISIYLLLVDGYNPVALRVAFICNILGMVCGIVGFVFWNLQDDTPKWVRFIAFLLTLIWTAVLITINVISSLYSYITNKIKKGGERINNE